MRALVTGGTGFIGKALLERLISSKHDVTALARHPPSQTSSLHWVQGDITLPKTLSHLQGQRFDRLFHVAGCVAFNAASRQQLHAVNVEGTKNILELAEQLEIPRTVVLSSVAAIGPAPQGEIANEATPFGWNRDDQPYSASKYDGEMIALEKARKGMSVVVVNPAFVFGEGDDHSPAMQLVRKVKRRRVPFYPPGGMCVVWVGDVVQGILEAVERGRSGEKYILGGQNLTNREAYAEIAASVGSPRPCLPFPKTLLFLYSGVAELEARALKRPPRYTRAWARSAGHKHFYSSDKAHRELGYTPLDFRSTLKRTVQWMQTQSLL